MKVLLISTYPQDVFYPIALLCLRSYLLAREKDIEVELIPTADETTWADIVLRKPDLIGFSAMTPSYEVATTLARRIRGLLPGVPIIIGGPHLTLLPESFRPCFDIGILGEGEDTLCDLVHLLRQTNHLTTTDLYQIPGLIFWVDGKSHRTSKRKPVDLSLYPDLDYSIIDKSSFIRKPVGAWGRFGVEGMIETSRGCPFRCLFCATTRFWDGVRYFPIDWVLRNVLTLIKRGCTLIHMTDDLFACNKKRLGMLARIFEKHNVQAQTQLAVSGRTSIFDDELCDLIKAVGGTTIFFGFESGNERILQLLKGPSAHVSDNVRAIQICQRKDIECWGAIMIGSPTETEQEILDTINFIKLSKDYGVRRVSVGITTPYPGTPLWDMVVNEGKMSAHMDFSIFETLVQGIPDLCFVPDRFKARFCELHIKAKRAAHSFKWGKAWSLFQSDPFATFQYALHAPWPIVRRLFDSTAA